MALNSTVFISVDPKSAASDSIILYVDRNNVGQIEKPGSYAFRIPSGEHFVILNVGEQYYTDHLTFDPDGKKAVSVSFPFPADDDKFLRSVSLSGAEMPRDILGERFSEKENAPVSLTYGNGNLLMNERLFNGLTASFSEGKRFVNLQEESDEILKWLKPADPRIFRR
ncbi:MAG TPA: hypothetical protein VLX68_17455 [Chitinivibrionales bacterium]|nr:hypothetical protein [Chitinivibrionales bacterium]